MKKVLIIFSALCFSWGTEAHQPDLSSTILVEREDSKWLLQIRAALIAFEYEVEQHYGASSYATPEEFQELVLSHIKKNVSISFNNNEMLELQNGTVNLAHETSVSFELEAVPKNIQSLQVTNNSFSNISRNQSALVVLKKGFLQNQFVLNNDNEHTAILRVKNTAFALVTNAPNKMKYYILIFTVLSFVMMVLYFLYKRKPSKDLMPVSLNN